VEGKRDEYGLTRKQRKFAENIVGGMNLSDAYRHSYDADGMTNAQIHREASLLGSNPKVTQCMEALAGDIRRKSAASTVSDRDNLIRLLRAWSNGEAPATQTQLRAAELLGKACGLYRDVVEDHRERPAALVAADLERRLSSLLAVQRVNADETGNDTDNVAGCGPSPSSDAGCGPAGSGVESLQ
jgi:hypothetical protein